MSVYSNKTRTIAAAAVAIMLLGGVSVISNVNDNGFFVSSAFADNHGGGQGGGGQGSGGGGGHGGGQGGGGGGHSGGGGGGHSDGGDSHSGGSDSHSSGGKKGGHDSATTSDEDSDGRGPKYGKPDGSRGKPVWAAEGIPEVELGRLNVIRAPGILDKAYVEALNTFNDPDTNTELYSMTAAEFIAKVRADFDSLTMVDSPLENLALMEDLLDDGTSTLPITPASTIDLAAIFLGSASDKNVPVSTDTVTAVMTIIGIDLDALGISASSLAAKADDVREAILAGHG
ncbi:hypothetical protein [Roseibium sp.]|uniref:hypothetical protein n=1 Tax=Roseibium sp. TaxID=1936156 RepID=UPI003A96CFAD